MSKLNQIIRKVIKEATSQRGGAAGQYVTPIQPGFRPFNETELTPYTQSVSKYKNPLVQYDSLDHKMDLRQDQIKKLEKELSRLNSIGGFDKIVPSEGIVFSYKGNAYKLTGAFAPLNQILGIFKFSR